MDIEPARPSRSYAFYDCFLETPVYGVSDSMCDRSDRSGSRARRQRKPLFYGTSRRRKEWRVPSGLVRHFSET